MKYLSVCSGIEAATVAWQPLGWEPVGFAEIEPSCRALLKEKYPHVRNYGDFTTIRPRNLRRLGATFPDLICGGTPCQDFSVAGKRAGLDGTRGNLTLEFVVLVRRLRPRWVVWENVPGVLSIDGGRAFGALLRGLEECGYGWAYRILDAQHFGVPQRRRRVFVVGYFGAWQPAAAVLLEPEGMRGDSPPSREAGQGTAGTLSARTEGGGGLGTDFDLGGALSRTLRAQSNMSHREDTDTYIPVTSFCLNGGAMRRTDGESETFITHSLRADGFDASEDGTGMGTPLVACLTSNSDGHTGFRDEHGLVVSTIDASYGRLQGASGQDANHGHSHLIAVPILEAGARTGKSTDDPRAGMGIGEPGDPMYTLQSGKQHAVAFDTTQVTSKANRSNPQPGDPCHPLAAGAHAPAITINFRGREGGTQAELGGEVATSLRCGGGTSSKSHALTGMAVRRLTPRECERLQGFPDDYTLVKFRRKPMADGPRYKMLGNSWAVPCVRWIGERIQAVEEILNG